jgi:hypothetical protein
MIRPKFLQALRALGLLLSIGSIAYADDRILEMNIENSGNYTVTVTRGDRQQILEISMGFRGARKVIAHYANSGFVYAKPNYPKIDRLITVWEPGVEITTTILRLEPPSAAPEILLEDYSVTEPDFVASGSFLVLYSGKGFVRSGLWIPTDAAVYAWNGRKYDLTEKVPYRQRFNPIEALERRESLRVQ